jgi:hypothetical protein
MEPIGALKEHARTLVYRLDVAIAEPVINARQSRRSYWMMRLGNHRQLLWVAEQDDLLRAAANRNEVCQGILPRLINDEYV